MTREEEDLLVEQVAGAFRPSSAGEAGELQYHKAWHDLGISARVRAYEIARAQRPLEAALDADGLSTTARAVLARIVETL
jgi:hypothetical protein